MSDLISTNIAEMNEFIEAEAYASYYLCAPPEFAKPFHLDVRHIGPMWVTMIPETDNPNHNLILGLGLGEPATESMLDEAIVVFQNAGCQNYRTHVSPLNQPAQYSEWLAARDFKPGRNWVKMCRRNEPTPAVSTDLRVETIGKDQADEYADVVLPVWGINPAYRPLVKGNVGKPGWYHYLAYDGKKPVSAAAMFISGEMAWLGWASTVSTHRKHGGQSAICSRMIMEGLAHDCKWFTAETDEETTGHPNPSYHIMLRFGFKLAYFRKNYTHRSPASLGKKIRRALFMAAYSLKFESQRLVQRGKAG
jgi:hypothetical protein